MKKKSEKRKRPSTAKRPKPAGARPKAQRPARAKTPRAGRTAPRRADFGEPIEAFFTRQPPHLRAILDALRKLVDETAPDATASLKWGMPFFSIEREMMCALAGFRSHVNLILAGPPGAFADPEGLLEGEGKTGRHLKLRALDELPREAVRGWLRAAAKVAREKAAGR
ncbi:DUF1801 domain-containing protein [Anaeromyxobacter oryzae]|uniref:YdhG-like domain-containing protein n=1 Tax=Anaeromyxobacter oryzae TaxID=2918170 RepID=A0ABN6MP68_9BACT|nr:DUF1801 domain-containing protein [Anaeromyxobacter oryzae]BDG01473.1 hypothetical protein AMOR_04690 [Anaeromyxobacter oryzae]